MPLTSSLFPKNFLGNLSQIKVQGCVEGNEGAGHEEGGDLGTENWDGDLRGRKDRIRTSGTQAGQWDAECETHGKRATVVNQPKAFLKESKKLLTREGLESVSLGDSTANIFT